MTTTSLSRLATEESYLSAYTRRRSGAAYDLEVLTFEVGTELYGIVIGSMREIIKLCPITEVPRTPPFVVGVVAVRGEVIPAIDLRIRLGMQPGELTRNARILLCLDGDDRYGLIVDQVHGVVRLREADIESAPALGAGPEGDFIAGIGRSQDLLIIMLDLPTVVRFTVTQ